VFKLNRKVFIFAVLFVLLIITPAVLNTYYNFLLKPVASANDTKIFVVAPNTPVVAIAQNLKEENLIKNTFAFRLLVAQMGIGKTIQAGDFRLSSSMSSREIAQELTHGAIDVWITLPEGLRVEEQAEIIEKMLNFASNDVYKFDKRQYTNIAEEGYMFPDTYLIPKDATAESIAALLRTTFEVKVDASIFEKAKKNNLAQNQLIILASLIEKEAKTDNERPVVAGIILNRLRDGISLDVDAAVSYAKGYDNANKTWWPQVTIEDYRNVKSLYNTYLNPGLPPGPISNPGLKSIEAAANPTNTPFYYYLHDSEGNIHYAETIEEHNQNIQDYLR